MRQYVIRSATATLLFAFALLTSSCGIASGRYPQRGQRPPNDDPDEGKRSPLDTLTVIVQQQSLTDPVHPDISLRFDDLRSAFLALRDSAKAGHNADVYQLLVVPDTYRMRRPMVWVVDEGVYGSPTLVMRPTNEGRVIVSGAEVSREGDPAHPWNDPDTWEVVDPVNNRYATDWPYTFGPKDINDFKGNYREWIENTTRTEILLRREMVIVDGEILDQRLDHERLLPGSFKVVESGGNSPGRLTIQLTEPLRQDMQIEIPVVEMLLVLRNFERVEISGIDFVRANPHHGNRAVTISGTESILLDNCHFNDHNWKGLGVGNTPLPTDYSRSDTLVMVNCSANRNGGMGMGASFVARLRVQDCELAENGWRSFAAGTTEWAVGGSKLFHTHDVTVTGMRAHDNYATGFWFDTDGERVLIENSVFADNARDGLFIEASQGPVVVNNCRFLNNARDGLRNNSSNKVTVLNSRFEYNRVAHYCFAGASRRFTNFETGRELHVTARKNLIRNNQFLGDPIWYAEEWISSKKLNAYLRDTRFVNNASWPYDSGNPFSQKPLPIDQR